MEESDCTGRCLTNVERPIILILLYNYIVEIYICAYISQYLHNWSTVINEIQKLNFDENIGKVLCQIDKTVGVIRNSIFSNQSLNLI